MKTNQQSRQFKYVLVALAVLAMISSSALSFAQCKTKSRCSKGSNWGVKGGLSFSNFYVDEIEDDTNLRTGFHAGIGGRVPVIGEFLAIQPEILYSNKGINANFFADGRSVKHEFALNYIDVPVMASVKLFGVNFHAGVYGSYLVKGKVRANDADGSALTGLDRSDFRPFDVGYTGGVSFNVAGMGVGARYNYGLREVAKTDFAQGALGNAKNSSLQVYVSLGIND